MSVNYYTNEMIPQLNKPVYYIILVPHTHTIINQIYKRNHSRINVDKNLWWMDILLNFFFSQKLFLVCSLMIVVDVVMMRWNIFYNHLIASWKCENILFTEIVSESYKFR